MWLMITKQILSLSHWDEKIIFSQLLELYELYVLTLTLPSWCLALFLRLEIGKVL